MGTVLNNLFGKGKGNYGDVEYWHGAERAGWLMKQGQYKFWQHYETPIKISPENPRLSSCK